MEFNDLVKFDRDRKEFMQLIIDRYHNKVFRARVMQIIHDTDNPIIGLEPYKSKKSPYNHEPND